MTLFRIIPSLATLLTAATLASCGSSDAPRIALNEVEGEYSGTLSSITINGVPSNAPRTIVKLPGSGTTAATLAFDGDMFVQSNSIYYFEVNADNSLSQQIPVATVMAHGTPATVTFSGSYPKPDGNSIQIDGRFETLDMGGKRRLVMEVTHDLSGVPFVGRTYLIEFNSTGIYPNVDLMPSVTYNDETGENLSARDILEWFFKEMTAAVTTATGYDAAKITFRPDMTLDISYRRKTTGDFVAASYTHRYFVNDGEIFFIAPEGHVRTLRQAAHFDGISPNQYLWYNLGISDNAGSYKVMAVNYTVNSDSSLTFKMIHGKEHLCFLNGWIDVVSSSATSSVAKFNWLTTLVSGNKLTFTPMAIAREI